MGTDSGPPVRNASIAVDRNASAAAIASGRAPILYFDSATIAGYGTGGVCHLVLETLIYSSPESGQKADRHFVTVAHLRMDLGALGSLKRAIEDIENLARPGPKGTGH